MGQSMAVSTLLRRVGRLLTNPSEGDQLVLIGKGDRKPPKQVDMGNSGQEAQNEADQDEPGLHRNIPLLSSATDTLYLDNLYERVVAVHCNTNFLWGFVPRFPLVGRASCPPPG